MPGLGRARDRVLGEVARGGETLGIGKGLRGFTRAAEIPHQYRAQCKSRRRTSRIAPVPAEQTSQGLDGITRMAAQPCHVSGQEKIVRLITHGLEAVLLEEVESRTVA